MRSLGETLKRFASEKFVLVSGPRQVGKTTLAKAWLEDKRGAYLNWDVPEDRARMLRPDFMSRLDVGALVLDEIHKYARWKSWLKGLYDKLGKTLEVVVTGSARLDVFQRGGDSLLGRYELLHLYPLSIGELTHGMVPPPPSTPAEWLRLGTQARGQAAERTRNWQRLEQRSGFPEPFYKDEALHHQRWVNRRRDLLVNEDLRELTQIKTLSLVEHLALLLPERVGSPLSVNALREDLQVAFDTAKNWIEAMERLYYCFRISPYHKRLNRSLRKEQKLYLWDCSQIEEAGARFENMVACHLLKALQTWSDIGYGDYRLHYYRDVEKREVDFVVTNRRKPLVVLECKRSDGAPSPALLHLGNALGVPQIQLVDDPGANLVLRSTRVAYAADYLAELP